MSAPAVTSQAGLPALVRSAAQKLAAAETSAEILEARDQASAAYDVAKIAARMAKAKAAHDDVISAVYRAQADALEIESMAKRRLADEYDAAQERGELRSHGGKQVSDAETPSFRDAGLTGKQIHEARQIRDAEAADPGVTRRTLDGLIGRGEEPTKAAVRRAISPSTPKPKPRVSDEALWLWGRLKDFESRGLLGASAPVLLSEMTPQMREDVFRLVPMVRELMEELETCCEPA